ENLRGNVNTRLRKVSEHNWQGAIFAAAGLERIDLRPENSIDLDWMLPSPAQGAIVVVCREDDNDSYTISNALNDVASATCTKIEKDFLRALSGGCSTPISALAVLDDDKIIFKGNICSPDGKIKIDIGKEVSHKNIDNFGLLAGKEFLQNEQVRQIIDQIKNGKK
ncbi:MAG: hydroxymethylbilane synthase, partial [Bacteroidota bacterium]|nr:hydroxymethylbilane synthase [Bacteroidota bacterium]